MHNWILRNGAVLVNGNFVEDDLAIIEGRFANKAAAGADEMDAAGCYVLPGIVDIHGDAFERIVQPRPGVFFDKQIALREADRQMIANGITTAFHGLGVSWEPGVRSMDASREFIRVWSELKDSLACDTHVNLRWEIFALDGIQEAIEWLRRFPESILSINDHATPFVGLEPDHPRIVRMSSRIGISAEESFELLSGLFARADEVPAALRLACKMALANGTKILAHDETNAEQRRKNRALGMSVSEFPMTAEAANEAISNGEHVVLGAPNVVRGGSQNNALCAASAISQGMCSALASDYYYPSLLLAAFKLADLDVLKLSKAWNLVSLGPAKAAGLEDRGEIEEGLRADAILVDQQTRSINAVFVGGKLVYRFQH